VPLPPLLALVALLELLAPALVLPDEVDVALVDVALVEPALLPSPALFPLVALVDEALVDVALVPDCALAPLPEELPDELLDASPDAPSDVPLETLPDELPADVLLDVLPDESSDAPLDESPELESAEASEKSLLRPSSEVFCGSAEAESSPHPDANETQKTDATNTKHPFCRYLPIFPPFSSKIYS
jgi:hypothetical protein